MKKTIKGVLNRPCILCGYTIMLADYTVFKKVFYKHRSKGLCKVLLRFSPVRNRAIDKMRKEK